jgi:midasin (ATPase involved in ribosome maturation)
MILDLRNENTEVYVYDFEDNVEITIIDHETAEKCLIKMPNKIVEIFKKYLQNEAESI